jgi:prepilin-type processing-associated H-X9-DG protein
VFVNKTQARYYLLEDGVRVRIYRDLYNQIVYGGKNWYDNLWIKPTGPDCFVITMEDLPNVSPGDGINADITILVDPNLGGRIQGSYAWTDGHGYSYKFLDPDGAVVVDQNGKACDPFQHQQKWWFEGGYRVSYGINGKSNLFSGDSQKILMVEYCKLVADVVGTQATDLTTVTDFMRGSRHWTGWGGGRARHLGNINVLYADGRVETTTPGAINPSMPRIHDELWRPQAVPRLSP